MKDWECSFRERSSCEHTYQKKSGMSRKNFVKGGNSGAWGSSPVVLGIAIPSNQMAVVGNSPFSQMSPLLPCHLYLLPPIILHSLWMNTAEQEEFMAYSHHVLCNKPLSFLIDKRGICTGSTDQQPPDREASASLLAYPFHPILGAP